MRLLCILASMNFFFGLKRILPVLVFCFSLPAWGWTQNLFLDSLITLGHSANRSANYELALKYFLLGKTKSDSLNETQYSLTNAYWVADVYRAIGKRPEALLFIRENLPKSIQSGENVLASKLLNLICSIHFEEYFSNKEYGLDSALFYGLKANSLIEDMKDRSALGQNLMLLGAIYNNLLKYDIALDYLHQAEILYRETGRTDDIPNILNNITATYMNQGKLKEAIVTAKESYELSVTSGIKVYQLIAVKNLVELNEKAGNFREAYSYLQLRNKIHETMLDENTMTKVTEMREKFESEKKEAENKILKSEVEGQRVFQISLTIVLILGGILFGVLIVAYRAKSRAGQILKKQKEEIEHYNELMFSLNVEIAETNEESKKKARLLDESNRIKDKLFSIISHDLRGPVSTLQSSLSLMIDKSFNPEEQASVITDLSVQVQSTSDLLNNLLYWSAGQMKGLTVQPAEFNINELLEENFVLFSLAAKRKGIHFKFVLYEKPLHVIADRNMINLVIRNLVSNAVKFTRSGEMISLDSSMEPGFAKITISDSGIGMSDSQLNKLFQMNEQTSMPGTENERGLGLGLVMVKEFVEKNNGTLSVKSEIGKGSEFTFLLPQRV
ncbi:MAG: tetratricopeptide repeat-containing sensor histidine kinase [Bacteroidetes bacterium]|nr:tetratricopeptide repeat-containing sensor histidine kinase [Bacteroidota bacterium]